MRLMTAIAIVAATWIGPPAPSATGEEPSTDSELLVAYCVGVFGADPAHSFQAPACLAEERTDECLVRIADIGRERQRVDRTLHQLQDFPGGARHRGPRTLPGARQVPGRDVVLGRSLTTPRATPLATLWGARDGNSRQ